jgi:hypothetical protein
MDLVHVPKGGRAHGGSSSSSTNIGGHRAADVPRSNRSPLSPRTPPIRGSPRLQTNPAGRGQAHKAPSDRSQRGSARIKERGFWVEMPTGDVLVATISADGYSGTIHDVSLEDLLAVVDRAEEELAQPLAP